MFWKDCWEFSTESDHVEKMKLDFCMLFLALFRNVVLPHPHYFVFFKFYLGSRGKKDLFLIWISCVFLIIQPETRIVCLIKNAKHENHWLNRLVLIFVSSGIHRLPKIEWEARCARQSQLLSKLWLPLFNHIIWHEASFVEKKRLGSEDSILAFKSIEPIELTLAVKDVL